MGAVARAFTVRIPVAWAGVDSASVRRWLLDFCRTPAASLPGDPGPGNRSKRVSFSLPARAVKHASACLDESLSATIRRIIASRTLPSAHPSFALPAPQDYELPRAKILPALLTPRAAPVWRRVPERGGWIPQRTLERSLSPALPASSVRAVDDPAARSESPSLLELALGVAFVLGIAVLAIWGLLRLFRASPKASVPAAAPVSVPAL